MANFFCRRRFDFARGWAVVLCIAFVFAEAAAQERDIQRISRSAKEKSKEKSKLREGARFVDKGGKVFERGGRYFFAPDGETEQFALLENLTLERVTSASSNQDDGQQWTITAVVTEFQGARFLLLERAVLRPTKVGRARNE